MNIHRWMTGMLEKQIDQWADDEDREKASTDDIGMVSFVAMGRRRKKIQSQHVNDGKRQANTDGWDEWKVIEWCHLIHRSRTRENNNKFIAFLFFSPSACIGMWTYIFPFYLYYLHCHTHMPLRSSSRNRRDIQNEKRNKYCRTKSTFTPSLSLTHGHGRIA